MRDWNDWICIRFSITGLAELDFERVEQDPLWKSVSHRYDSVEPALADYLARYLGHEVLLDRVPSANGPASILEVRVEKISRGTMDIQESEKLAEDGNG